MKTLKVNKTVCPFEKEELVEVDLGHELAGHRGIVKDMQERLLMSMVNLQTNNPTQRTYIWLMRVQLIGDLEIERYFDDHQIKKVANSLRFIKDE